MWGSSSSQTDPSTGPSTPSPRRFLFQRTRIHDNDHQDFVVYVNPRNLHRFLLARKRQNAREKDYTPSRATTPVQAGVARHRLV
jgi:hypothetical protein